MKLLCKLLLLCFFYFVCAAQQDERARKMQTTPTTRRDRGGSPTVPNRSRPSQGRRPTKPRPTRGGGSRGRGGRPTKPRPTRGPRPSQLARQANGGKRPPQRFQMAQDDDTFNRVTGVPRWAREGPDNPIFGLPAKPGLPRGFAISGHYSVPCSSNCPAVPRRCKMNFGDVCGQGCFCNNDPTLTPTARPTPLPGAPTFEPSKFNGYWALTHRPTNGGSGSGSGGGGGGGGIGENDDGSSGGDVSDILVPPTPQPSVYFIPCSSNCPSVPALAPLCGFFQTCGNGCYCGTAPGVPSPFPTRRPTQNIFVLITPSPSPIAGPSSVSGGRGAAPRSRSGQNTVTNTNPPVTRGPVSSPTNAPISPPTQRPTPSMVAAQPPPAPPVQAPPPADHGGFHDGGHTDDHDHASQPAGSNSAGAVTKDDNTISTGAIAGIAVGSVVIVILIAAAAFALVRNKNPMNNQSSHFPGIHEGTIDQIYAARKSAEISRLSGGFTPHLAGSGMRPSLSRASTSRSSTAMAMAMAGPGPRRSSFVGAPQGDGNLKRQSFSPGNNLGGRGGGNAVGYPAPRPSPSYNSSQSPYDL